MRTTDVPAGCKYDTFADYRFNDLALLIEALIPKKDKPIAIGAKTATEGNRRLAWLGDSVLRTALLEPWYHGQQTRNQAVTRWAGNMMSNQHLSNVAINLEIDHCMSLEQGLRFDEINEIDRASTVEALIGAVYVDCGRDIGVVQGVMGVLGLECPVDASAGLGVGEVNEETVGGELDVT